jgi:hypothetical protein
MVVITTQQYHSKIQGFLSDPAYNPIQGDPTWKVEWCTDDTTCGWPRDKLWMKTWRRYFSLSHWLLPRLYGLHKIHKVGVHVGRTVVKFGTRTYHLSKHLAELFIPSVGNVLHCVKNISNFIQTIGMLAVGSENIMVSFGLVSLFTHVPPSKQWT